MNPRDVLKTPYPCPTEADSCGDENSSTACNQAQEKSASPRVLYELRSKRTRYLQKVADLDAVIGELENHPFLESFLRWTKVMKY